MASKIFRHLPRGLKTGALAREFATALAGPLDSARAFVARLPVYLTPESMPVAWLDWMLYTLGVPVASGLPEDRKRQVLRVAVATWVNKGPASSIQRYVRALAGIESVVTTLPVYGFIAGVAKAGDICGIIGWRFDVEVPTGSISEAELRRLLVPVVPEFCSYTVTFS